MTPKAEKTKFDVLEFLSITSLSHGNPAIWKKAYSPGVATWLQHILSNNQELQYNLLTVMLLLCSDFVLFDQMYKIARSYFRESIHWQEISVLLVVATAYTTNSDVERFAIMYGRLIKFNRMLAESGKVCNVFHYVPEHVRLINTHLCAITQFACDETQLVQVLPVLIGAENLSLLPCLVSTCKLSRNPLVLRQMLLHLVLDDPECIVAMLEILRSFPLNHPCAVACIDFVCMVPSMEQLYNLVRIGLLQVICAHRLGEGELSVLSRVVTSMNDVSRYLSLDLDTRNMGENMLNMFSFADQDETMTAELAPFFVTLLFAPWQKTKVTSFVRPTSIVVAHLVPSVVSTFLKSRTKGITLYKHFMYTVSYFFGTNLEMQDVMHNTKQCDVLDLLRVIQCLTSFSDAGRPSVPISAEAMELAALVALRMLAAHADTRKYTSVWASTSVSATQHIIADIIALVGSSSSALFPCLRNSAFIDCVDKLASDFAFIPRVVKCVSTDTQVECALCLSLVERGDLVVSHGSLSHCEIHVGCFSTFINTPLPTSDITKELLHHPCPLCRHELVTSIWREMLQFLWVWYNDGGTVPFVQSGQMNQWQADHAMLPRGALA